MNSNPNAPEVDVLARMCTQAAQYRVDSGYFTQSELIAQTQQDRTAVADRDRLANENAALREALQRIATGATGYPDRDTQLAEIAQAAIANTPATTGDDAT